MKENNEIMELLNNAKKDSIGVKREEMRSKFRSISKKTMLLLFTSFLILSVVSCGIGKISNMNHHDIGIETIDINFDHNAISSLKAIKQNNALGVLRKYDICDNSGNVLGADLEVYKRIQGIDESDLIGYYEILGKEECEKVVIALGYEGWDDYLIKNGHLNKNDQPSIEAWEYSVDVELQRQIDYINETYEHSKQK